MSYISDFIDFLNNSPTPFHVVKTVCKYLSFAGFIELKETECWSECIKPGNKYYVTRNTSSIIAFSIGEDWKPGNPIALSCAHVDSPSLKIKPISKKTFEGYLQVGIETYGGGIWHSWFDRDLGVAGRVMVQEKDGSIKQCLIDIRKPYQLSLKSVFNVIVMRIPTLAIHLDREVNQKFEFNKETQFLPILGLESQKNRKCRCADDSDSRHHNELLDFISRELKIEKEQIIDFELMLRDTQPACIGGINEEFVFSGRLDDQTMCYSILRGFLESLAQEDKSCFNSIIKLIALFDHEEVGSVSAHGAESTFLPSILKRLFSTQLAKQFCDPISLEQSLSKSFLISADMGHALHPNYYSKYESNHKPKLNKGLVLKINSNQRYATNSPGIALVHEIARRANTNIQFFVNDNTIISGSTIGPLLSKSLGIRAVDVGLPQLSMHSIREMAGIEDVNSSILFFKSYYENYADIQKKITVD